MLPKMLEQDRRRAGWSVARAACTSGRAGAEARSPCCRSTLPVSLRACRVRGNAYSEESRLRPATFAKRCGAIWRHNVGGKESPIDLQGKGHMR
jgi:hypothetical protein